METRLYKQIWVTLPHDIRQALAEAFQMKRSERTEVVDNRIVSDGFSDDSLAVINVARMQELIGSTETDFTKLFDLTVKKLMHIEDEKTEIEEVTAEEIEKVAENVEVVDNVSESVDNDKVVVDNQSEVSEALGVKQPKKRKKSK